VAEKCELIDLNFSSFIFDRSHPSLIRDRIGHFEERHSSYDDTYDFDTLFYDAYFDSSASQVVLVSPPLLNFKRLIEDTEFFLDEHAAQISSVVDISRGSLIFIDAEVHPPQRLSFQHPRFGGEVQINNTCLDAFAGKNAVYAISKNNRLDWLVDWLTYYANAHDANALVLYDNASTDYSIDELIQATTSVRGIDTVAIGRANFPFGPRGTSNTDYKSLFLQRTMAEIGRRRLLLKSRAVLNVDIDELMYSHSGQSIFDATVASREGYVRANAAWVYTDSTEIKGPPSFSAHRYVSGSGRPKSNRKFCVDPQGPLFGKQWLTHFIKSRRDPVDPNFVMWHFSEISTGWKYDRSGLGGPDLKECPELINAMEKYIGTRKE
jgi:hypothetical protein